MGIGSLARGLDPIGESVAKACRVGSLALWVGLSFDPAGLSSAATSGRRRSPPRPAMADRQGGCGRYPERPWTDNANAKRSPPPSEASRTWPPIDSVRPAGLPAGRSISIR